MSIITMVFMLAAQVQESALDDKAQNEAFVEPSFAIDVIANREGLVRNIEWRIEEREGELLETNGAWSLKNEARPRVDGLIRRDCLSDRYFAEVKHVGRVTGGLDPDGKPSPQFLQGDCGSSFDSKVFRQWQRSGTFRIETDDILQYGDGLIDKNSAQLNDATFLKSFASSAGLHWMPPGFLANPDIPHVADSLSGFLKDRLDAGQLLNIKDTGVRWIINTFAVGKSDEYPVSFEIHWDIEQQAVVEQIWYYDFKGKREVLTHVRTTNEKVGNLWIPSEVFLVEFRGANAQNYRSVRWRFSDVRVNRSLADSDFRITFPPDIQLTDYIEGKRYLTGSSAIDEQRAIRDFVTLTGGSPSSSGRSGEFSWLLSLNVAVAVAFLIYLAFRRWRRLSCILLPLMIVHGSLVFGDDGLPEKTKEHASFISYAHGERITVSRCGFRATLAALEWFKVPCQAEAVDESLVPFSDGTRLADLAMVLESHGLKVDLRKGVSLEEIAQAVHDRRIAVFPVLMSNGWNHYYMAVRTKSLGVRILDPPNGSYPVASALRPEALSATGGAVLFVEKVDVAAQNSPQLRIQPSILDFGEFAVEGESSTREIHRELQLKNTGTKPLVVSKIRSSCGCARIDWVGGLIRPGEVRKVIAILRPEAWGAGAHTKAMEFDFANGAPGLPMEVTGTGSKLTELHRVQVTPRQLTFRKEPGNEIYAPERITISGLGSGIPVSGLQSTASEPWLQIAQQSVDESSVIGTVSVTPSLFPAGASVKGAKAEIRFTTPNFEEPFTIQVQVAPAPAVVLEPTQLTMLCGVPAQGTVSFTATTSHDSMVDIAVDSITPLGLFADVTQVGDRLQLTLRHPNEVKKTQIFVVVCSVRMASGRAETHHLVVRVESNKQQLDLSQ